MRGPDSPIKEYEAPRPKVPDRGKGANGVSLKETGSDTCTPLRYPHHSAKKGR